ncbi:hypothetical protein SFC43_09005 [Bacteroides sp. CR5/BHMF/2]|nr:hypothetical protein [Bacteroides sp. CR5/BHMF/2]
MGIGGYVRATAEYDFNGIVNDVDFYPALIPQRGSGNFAKNQFQMDITTSTLFLKLVGRTKHLGDFVVYTAGNFRGDGKTFELQNSLCAIPRFHDRIQLRFVHGPLRTASYHRLCRS